MHEEGQWDEEMLPPQELYGDILIPLTPGSLSVCLCTTYHLFRLLNHHGDLCTQKPYGLVKPLGKLVLWYIYRCIFIYFFFFLFTLLAE